MVNVFSILWNPIQHGFVVVDAGGATLDISSYVIKAVSPLLVEEIARPDSVSSFFSVYFRFVSLHFQFRYRSFLWFSFC